MSGRQVPLLRHGRSARRIMVWAFLALLLSAVAHAQVAQAATWHNEQEMADSPKYRDTFLLQTPLHHYWTRSELINQHLADYKALGMANVLLWGQETTSRVSPDATWTGCGTYAGPESLNGLRCPDGHPMNVTRVSYALIDTTLQRFTENGAWIAEVCGNTSSPVPPGSTSAPTISGYKFDDLNGNGHWDPGEPGLAGWTIELIQNGSVIATTVTDASGYYSFHLDAQALPIDTDSFQLAEVQQAGWRATTSPGTVSVPFGSGAATFANEDFGNEQTTDLAITKAASAPVTVAGEQVSWSMQVTNHGIFSTPGVTVNDPIPAGLTGIDQLDRACRLNGSALLCNLGTLAAGATRTVSFRSRVDPAVNKGVVITNRASVSSAFYDTNPADNSAAASTTVDTRADLVVSKTASKSHVIGGDPIDYTLSVTNNGPSDARGVQLDDTVPNQIAVLDTSDDGACSINAQAVACDIGLLAPGATARVVIDGRALGSAPPPADPSHGDHQLLVEKQEVTWDLQAGGQGTFDASCPAGEMATDGSFRTDAVDQGTGTLGSVHLIADHAVSAGTYAFTALNTATGRAQGHATVTCLATSTVGGDGPALQVAAGAQLTRTDTLAPGLQTVTLEPGLERHAVAPGFVLLGGSAQLVGSAPTADGGWSLSFQVTATATIQSSILPLVDRLTGAADGHSNMLVFNDLSEQVTLPAGDSQYSLDCGQYAKGITASWTLAPGVLLTGNEPRPQNRNFWLENSTGQPQTVTLDVLCLDVRTSGPVDQIGVVTNTAAASSTTTDPELGNNQASASVSIETAVGSSPAGASTYVPHIAHLRMRSHLIRMTISTTRHARVRLIIRAGRRVVLSRTITLGRAARRSVSIRLSRSLERRLRREGGSIGMLDAGGLVANAILIRT